MAGSTIEINPVSRITVGAVGRPGHRVFFLQASGSDQTYTFKLEKTQVVALAQGIDTLLEELAQRETFVSSSQAPVPASEFELLEPIEQEFVIGNLGLLFDQDSDLLVIVAQELTRVEDEQLGVAHIWASADQMQALSIRAKAVAAQGRPICPFCGEPVDPEGHFCPKRNGHGKAQQTS